MSTFLDAVNRGGLHKPSDFTFLLALHCWRLFKEIKSSPDLLKKFLTATTHRALFCKVIDRACCIETFGHVPIDSSVCVAGHDLKGHSGAELHIYFLVHLESIYYEIFFYSKIVPNYCAVAK